MVIKDKIFKGPKEKPDTLKDYINDELLEMVRNKETPPDPTRLGLLNTAMKWIQIRERLPDDELGSFYKKLEEDEEID